MSVYDANGNSVNILYDGNENLLSVVYDADGESIPLVVFLDSAIVTDTYVSTISSLPQGGCIDDNGNVYVCFYNAGKFLKHNIISGTETEVSFTPETYGHANGMAYNPNTGYLYLASMKNTGEVYVFDKSFNLVDTLYAKNANNEVFNCWNIAYDRKSRKFITMTGGVMYFMDDNFDYTGSVPYNINDWGYTRQDIETDGDYVYCLSSNANHIYVYDLQGNFIKDISNIAFTGEPESMCYDWINGKYYTEGIDSGKFVIREEVFKG